MPYVRGAFGGSLTSDQLDGCALSSELVEVLAGHFKSYAEADPAKLTSIDPIEMKMQFPNGEKLQALYAKELPAAAAMYSAHRKR